jgi:DNA-binding NarL/FixJ family response regulator
MRMTRTGAFTQAELDRLADLLAEGHTYRTIAPKMNRSLAQLERAFRRICKRLGPQAR